MIGSAELGFLASFNLPTVEVFVRPRVAILTGGNELKPLGGELGDDDLIGSSLYYLEEELKQCGCEPRQFGIAKDDLEDYMTRFAAALEWADLIVTTAGVSVGAHDLVGEVIERFSGHVHFWRVAVRPGKPMLVASYGSCHHFGFPGNPVSTCCNVEIFLKPFLRQAFGMAQPIAEVLPLRLAEPCPRDHARLFFVYSSIERAEDGAQVVRPLPNQNSGNFSLCANANALIVSQPAPDPIPSGAAVPVIPITRGL
jgi:molybdopterin molybdotransferase